MKLPFIHLGVVDISTFFCLGPARSAETAASTSVIRGSSASSDAGSTAGGADSNCNLGDPPANSVIFISVPDTEQRKGKGKVFPYSFWTRR